MTVLEKRAAAFTEALDDILVTDTTEDPTALTPPAVLVELVAETRTGVTPPPAPLPLGSEARDLRDRVRFVLLWQVGLGAEQADAVLTAAHDLMPRVRR